MCGENGHTLETMFIHDRSDGKIMWLAAKVCRWKWMIIASWRTTFLCVSIYNYFSMEWKDLRSELMECVKDDNFASHQLNTKCHCSIYFNCKGFSYFPQKWRGRQRERELRDQGICRNADQRKYDLSFFHSFFFVSLNKRENNRYSFHFLTVFPFAMESPQSDRNQMAICAVHHNQRVYSCKMRATKLYNVVKWTE